MRILLNSPLTRLGSLDTSEKKIYIVAKLQAIFSFIKSK